MSADSTLKWGLGCSLSKQTSSFRSSTFPSWSLPSLSSAAHQSQASCVFPFALTARATAVVPSHPTSQLLVMGLSYCCPSALLLAAHTPLLRCPWLGHASHPTQVLIHGVKNNSTACLLSATLPVLCCVSWPNFLIFLYVQCLCRRVRHAITTCRTNSVPSVIFFPC